MADDLAVVVEVEEQADLLSVFIKSCKFADEETIRTNFQGLLLSSYVKF